ncbi:uncharacterized protein LOC143214143 [Lasioglossum baleicum]|uniref:uncharacterized protein LOC143214143 n=1 Tax=Lasioglossum baleicum TaxID=434251 RepID=UPI003FCD5D8B
MSIIARLFDPLGLVSPVVVNAKILLQKVWLAKCGWDEPLPIDLQLEWENIMQRDSFPAEIDSLTKEHRVAKSSSIVSLNPFLDSEGVLRVGGRLGKSNLPEKTKHPVFLHSHPILTLIISHHHLRTLHGGSSLTLALLRDEYWILQARTTVRAVLHRCVARARENALVPTELMGELPVIRTTRTARAFVHTGVDYDGPILVRNPAGRGHQSHKAYIALLHA